MNINRIYVVFGVLFVLVIGVAGYYWFIPEESAICSGQIGDLSIGVYHGEVSSLVYVAEEFGFFNENGLDVSIIEFVTGRSAVNGFTSVIHFLQAKRSQIEIVGGTFIVPFVKDSLELKELKLIEREYPLFIKKDIINY